MTLTPWPAHGTEPWDTAGTLKGYIDDRDALAIKVGTGVNPLTGWVHVDGYGADPTGGSDDTTAFTAAMVEANANEVPLYCPGEYNVDTGTIVIAANGVKIKGANRAYGDRSRINFTGTGVGVDYDDSDVRRECGVSDIDLYCATAGATAYRLANTYAAKHYNANFQSQAGTTGIGVHFDGDISTSTYLNEFFGCDAWGSLDSVKMGNNVNGNNWFGGKLIGPGRSVHMHAPTHNMGSNKFFGVAIQSEGTNTSGELVRMGDVGDVGQSAYNSFIGCRFETNDPTTIVTGPLGWYNTFLGGSIALGTTFDLNNTSSPQTDPLILINSGGAVDNWVYQLSVGTLTGDLEVSALEVDPASANTIKIDGGSIKAAGSGTNQNFKIAAKGTGLVTVNADPGDATNGQVVYTGGATPKDIAYIAANGIPFSTYLYSSHNHFEAWKSSDSQARTAIDYDGKLQFGPGSGAVDTNLYRSAANTLKTDDSFVVGGDLTIAGTTVQPAWTAPTLAGSWVNYASGEENAGYRVRADGDVEMRGCIKSGSGVICTLPVGARPAGPKMFVVAADNAGTGAAQIYIPTNGQVQVIGYIATGNNTALYLDGIRFPRD